MTAVTIRPQLFQIFCKADSNRIELLQYGRFSAFAMGCALFQKVLETESGLTHKAGFSYTRSRKVTP